MTDAEMTSILFDNYLIISIAWLAGLVGVTSNLYVFIKCFHKIKKFPITASSKSVPDPKTSISARRHIFYILVMNMAIGDILGSFYLLILVTADIRYRYIQLSSTKMNSTLHSINSSIAIELFTLWLHDPICSFARFIHFLSINHSIIMTGLIATDRFLRVKYTSVANLRITTKMLLIISLFPWIISLPSAAIGMILVNATTIQIDTINSYRYHNLCSYDDIKMKLLKIYLLVSILLGTLVYIAVFTMYIVLVSQIEGIRYRQLFTSARIKDRKLEDLILITVIMITVTNFITWFPAFVVGIITILDYNFVNKINTFSIVSSIFVDVFQSNSAINPLILIYNTRQRRKKVNMASR